MEIAFNTAIKFCKILTERHIIFKLLADANFSLTPASTVLIRYVSVHRQNSPYFAKSLPHAALPYAL